MVRFVVTENNWACMVRPMRVSLLRLLRHALSSRVRPVGIFAHELHEPSAGQASQGRRRQRIRLSVVVDIDIQPIHHVEMRIGEKPLHRGIANIGSNRARHEGREVRIGCKGSHVVQGQPRRGALASQTRDFGLLAWSLPSRWLNDCISATLNRRLTPRGLVSEGVRSRLDLVRRLPRTHLGLTPGPSAPKAIVLRTTQASSPDPP